MRILIACVGLAALGLAQNSYVAEGSLIGGGSSGGFSVEVSEVSGKMRLAKVPVHIDSSFRVDIPVGAQMLEFRILSGQGEVIQVLHQTPQRGVPIELRLTAIHNVVRAEAAISLKRLSFQPSSKLRRAFSQSQKLRTGGKKAEAMAAMQEIVTTEPAWFEAWLELGRGQTVLGNSKAAVVSLRQALAIDPNAAEVYPSLGIALLHSGQLDEAAKMAEQGLKLKPDCLRSKYVLGLAIASDREQSLRAVALLDEVQAYYPDAMLPLAVLLLRLGQFEASRDAAWRYLHMVPAPRAELASSIWREASLSLRASNTK